MTVNTKEAERRSLTFARLDEILEDAERIAEAERAGELTTTGNWSAGQIFKHLGDFMTFSLDGFPPEMRPPLALKLFAKVIKLGGFKKPPPAGFKIPKGVDALRPDAGVTLDEGLAALRSPIERALASEKFAVASPLFGKLSHEQWTDLHLGHAALHMSFLHPGASSG